MAKASKQEKDVQKRWEERISRAKEVRKKWKDLFNVDMAREYFDGKQNPGFPDEEWITINKIYSHLKAQLPSLYNVDPYFYVRLAKSFSVNPLDIAIWEKKGKVRQNYLNYLKKELSLKQKVRLSIQDAHFAIGVAKAYYHADMKENPDAGKAMLAEDGETPLFDDGGNPLMEPDEIPVNERYCLSRVHPDDFLWDEDAGPLEDSWKWVAQCIRMTLEDIKKDRRFNKAAIKALERGKGGEGDDKERKEREERKKGGDIKGKIESENPSVKGAKKDEAKIYYLWEIYDLKEDRWTLIAENGEIPLVSEETLPKGVEKHPFAILRFTLRDDSPYPIPPVSQGIDPQREFNTARSRIMTHRKRFNRKYLATGPWEADELSKLESGDDGTIIKAQIGSDVKPITDAPLDSFGTYTEVSYLEKDMIELMGGATAEARGIAGADSATQAGILDKRMEMKEGDAMSMVIDFVTDIVRKLDKLVQANITRDEAIRITGPEGEFWALVRQDDYQEINGEFQYDVNTGATIPNMPQMERASWMAFLTLLAGFPHLLLNKHLLKRMAEMHHIEDEVMLEELYQLGQKIMGGQMPMPGQQGSAPNQSETKPQAVTGGQAGGPMSLAMPLAGNAMQ